MIYARNIQTSPKAGGKPWPMAIARGAREQCDLKFWRIRKRAATHA